MEFAEIQKRKRLGQATVTLPLDPTIHDRLKLKRAELQAQEVADELTNERDEAPEIRKEIDALETEMRENSFTITLSALPRAEYRGLISAHPPQPEDREAGLDYNGETLFAPLISACAVEPKITIDEAETILETWSDADCTLLFVTALGVNKEMRSIPKAS